MEQRLTESTAENQKLKEEIAKIKEEAKQSELEKKELKEKASQLESGSILNQKIIDAVMQKFFSSEAWINTQIDNFISSGKSIPYLVNISYFMFPSY